MNWAAALKIAAGVSSFLGLASVIAVLYFWRESTRKYPSIRKLIGIEGVSDSQLATILREFKHEHRIEALEMLLGQRQAKQLMDRIKGDLDPLALDLHRDRRYIQRFALLLVASLVIASLSIVGSMGSLRKDPLDTLVSKIDYQDIASNRGAIDAIVGLALAADRDDERDVTVSALKQKLRHRSTIDFDETGRAIRKALLEAIIKIRNHSLRRDFLDGQLAQMDLVGIDLSNVDAEGVKFTGALMIGSDFRGANLRLTDFSDTYLRNVEFQYAQLEGATFSGADWFNARGLSREQVVGISRSGLLPCPANFVSFANDRYVIPYREWSPEEQRNAVMTWAQYRSPGGLCNLVKEELSAK